MDGSTIYQRTESGRETIKTKSQKLTQSERLLLIIIDGVTPLDVMRKEIWSLSPERFERALKTLQKKELISEVLLPIQGQTPEQLDTAEVDRFLQQDPLDPVTIISFDPEDEFGLVGGPATTPGKVAPAESSLPERPSPAAAAQAADLQLERAIAAVTAEPPAVSEPDPPALKSLARHLALEREQQAEPFAAQAGASSAVPPFVAEPVPEVADAWLNHHRQPDESQEKGQWLYWAALIAGVCLIVGSLAYRALG